MNAREEKVSHLIAHNYSDFILRNEFSITFLAYPKSMDLTFLGVECYLGNGVMWQKQIPSFIA